MRLIPPPPSASWVHRDSRTGFEVVFFHGGRSGTRLQGWTTGTEDSSSWAVSYDVEVDHRWRTISAHVECTAVGGTRRVLIERSKAGAWTVDGAVRPDLDGCVDIDFEASAVTNTLPIHRIDLLRGRPEDVPAVFVHTADLRVERISQSYELRTIAPDALTIAYRSKTFDFACDLTVDSAGLIIDYPGIAVRSTG